MINWTVEIMLCMLFGQCPLLVYTETGTVTSTWEPALLQMSAIATEHDLNCLNSAVMSLFITAVKAPQNLLWQNLNLKWKNWTLVVLTQDSRITTKNFTFNSPARIVLTKTHDAMLSVQCNNFNKLSLEELGFCVRLITSGNVSPKYMYYNSFNRKHC